MEHPGLDLKTTDIDGLHLIVHKSFTQKNPWIIEMRKLKSRELENIQKSKISWINDNINLLHAVTEIVTNM